MPDANWLHLVGAALAHLAGFAWLSLAMDVHWQQVQPSAAPSPRTRALLRLLGGGSLAIGSLLCFLADRPSMAALVWLMLLVATAPLVALTLAWRPRLLCALWPGAEAARPD